VFEGCRVCAGTAAAHDEWHSGSQGGKRGSGRIPTASSSAAAPASGRSLHLSCWRGPVSDASRQASAGAFPKYPSGTSSKHANPFLVQINPFVHVNTHPFTCNQHPACFSHVYVLSSTFVINPLLDEGLWGRRNNGHLRGRRFGGISQTKRVVV
jgi:hypothetical protein